MSCSEGAASGQPSNLHPYGSKRGACDRCRGQKLRCLREDQSQGSLQATCVRCFKAGAICSYGIAKRAGRTPGSNATPSQERGGKAGGKPKKNGVTSRPTVSANSGSSFLSSETDGWQNRRGNGDRDGSLSLGMSPADQASDVGNKNITTVHASNSLPLDDNSNIFGGLDLEFPAFAPSSTTTSSWSDKILPPFFDDDIGEASSLDPFGLQYSGASYACQAQPLSIQIPTASTNDNDEQSRDISAASDETMDLDLPGDNAHTAQFGPTKALNARPDHARGKKRETACISENIGMRSAAEVTFHRDFTAKDDKIKVDGKVHAVNEIQHQRMQELSELTMDLYAQLAANEPGNHQPMPRAAATKFQDQFIGSVLTSANTFLTLLISFSAPVESSSNSGASPSVSGLDHDDPAMDGPVQHPHPKLPAGACDDFKPLPPIDMTTVLQLLTCYIRITYLYSIMYTQILDYILAFPQRVDSVPPIFPGMQVGGVSLNRFGTFQVKLLLQVSVHVLEEIELTLGLPQEYRISKRKGREGILGQSVSEGFLKCLMREGAGRGNKVECVREQLGSLRGVLKVATDFQ